MDDAKEGISIAKIALGVIIFLVLAGIVFALVRMGTNKVNSATNDLSNQLDTADLMQYAKYDNAEVTGTDVLTAIKTYQSSELKVFVATHKMMGNYYDPNTGSSNLGTINTKSYGYMSDSNSNDENGTNTPNMNTTTGQLEADIIKTTETFNLSFSELSTKTEDAYIKQSGRFYGYLVYDTTTGELAGLAFYQTK